nr:transposase (putative), gypsy type [Tanacetum cinerariifolium]
MAQVSIVKKASVSAIVALSAMAAVSAQATALAPSRDIGAAFSVTMSGIMIGPFIKPVEKTARVSLVPDFTPRLSSGVREAPSRDRQDPLNPGLICMRMVLTKNRCAGGYLILVGCGPVGSVWRLGPNSHIHEHVPSSVVSTKCWLTSLAGSHLVASDCATCTFAPVVCFLSCPSTFLFLILLGYPPFESFAMSLEESDDLNVPDATPVDPVLEAGILPKFDMHMYKSSLDGVMLDIWSSYMVFRRTFIRGLLGRAGKDCKPCLKDALASLKKWKDNLFLVDRRAVPIAMC